MKAILMSIRPQHVANILNGEKTIEIRKRFPSNYVGWVYIYCTKSKPYLFHEKGNVWGDDIYELTNDSTSDLPNYKHAYVVGGALNGKVVARFWCDKVEEIEPFYDDSDGWFTSYVAEETWIRNLVKYACLTEKELDDYLKRKNGYAIHIDNLVVFDKPKELKEFDAYCKGGMKCLHCKHHWTDDSAGYSIDKCGGKPLTRAPESYCYIEV